MMKSKLLFIIFLVSVLIYNINVAVSAQPPPGDGSSGEPVARPSDISAGGLDIEADDKAVSADESEDDSGSSADEVADVKKAGKPGTVTLIFKDADIRTVLHTLSYKSGVNIVASSDVEGKVNIRLVEVPWKTALEVILKNNGLSYEEVGNIIRVITLASVAEEELQNEVFVLNYSKAKEVAEAIEDAVTERGKVKYDERTNTVIITDIPTNIYKIRTVIERLDRRTPQVYIESKIIETRLDRNDDLGIDWGVQVTASGGKRPTTVPFERDGTPFSRRIDGKKEDTSMDSYFPLGTDAEAFPSVTSPVFPYVTNASDLWTFGTLDFTEFSAVLKMLKDRTDTKVISNPNITTLNNQKARVIVGEIFNIPTYERNDQTGNMEITGYTEKDIGIILTVIPHVNEAGDIVIDLKPEVSAFKDWDTFGTGTNSIKAPRFTTRTAETQVMIKDGQTIAIGGLVEETVIKKKTKVPLLGDIPLLGELFKYTEDDIDTKDLLIFVTVNLVKEDHDDKALLEEAERKASEDKALE